MTSQGQPAWPTLLTPTLATAGEKRPKGGGSPEAGGGWGGGWRPLPSLLTQRPVWKIGPISSRPQHEEMQQVFLSPEKRFSTEQVTAPPYFLHTIVSRVPALPSALAPASPHLRTCVRGVSVVRSSELVFFSDMPENASVCAAQRQP